MILFSSSVYFIDYGPRPSHQCTRTFLDSEMDDSHYPASDEARFFPYTFSHSPPFASFRQKPEHRNPLSIICIVFCPVFSQTMPPCFCVITAAGVRMTLVFLDWFAYLQFTQSFILPVPIQKFLQLVSHCPTAIFHPVLQTRYFLSESFRKSRTTLFQSHLHC